MKLATAILMLLVSNLLSGCTLLGVIVDSSLTDNKDHTFQDLGKQADKNFFTSEDAKHAQLQSLKRDCQSGKVEFRECMTKIKPENL